MRTARCSLTIELALRPFGCALVAAAALLSSTVSCSSDDEAEPSGAAPDAGDAPDASGDDDASDGGDGGDPSRNADPMDLDPTNGDPSLDIASSWIYFDSGQPWVRVEFHAEWPAPATVYYWSCSVLLGTSTAPLVTYNVQSLNGTQSDSSEGLDKAKITFVTEPKGFRVLFADASLAFDNYGLECSAKKTKTSPLAQDSSGSFPVTNKVQSPFGP